MVKSHACVHRISYSHDTALGLAQTEAYPYLLLLIPISGHGDMVSWLDSLALGNDNNQVWSRIEAHFRMMPYVSVFRNEQCTR